MYSIAFIYVSVILNYCSFPESFCLVLNSNTIMIDQSVQNIKWGLAFSISFIT